MKAFLKKYGVWEIVINVVAPSNKKPKAANQKEAKKNNTTTLKFLLDGLPSSIRESLGEFTSARELWLKLEGNYQGKVQGKQLEDEQERILDPIHDEVNKALAEDDEKLIKDSENAEREMRDIINKGEGLFVGALTIKVNEKDIIKAKNQLMDSLQKYQLRTKELKDLLKKLKDENSHLLVLIDEKDEEIDKLKEEVSNQEEVEDDAHLGRELKEARRKEEVLKDQLEKKNEALEKQLERARWKEEDLKEQL